MQFRILGPALGLAAGFICGAHWQGARESSLSSLSPGTATAPLVRPSSAPAFVRSITQVPEPSLQVDSSGFVSGHFDRVTPAWLSGALERAGLTGSTTGASASPVASTDRVAMEEATEAVILPEAALRLRGGTEAERFAVLTQAVELGQALPANDLINVFKGDPSDRVALLAFSAHVDSVAEDASAAREALARGLESGNAAVREDATRRMIEMESLARVQASTPEQGLE